MRRCVETFDYITIINLNGALCCKHYLYSFTDSQNQRSLKSKELTSILARMHSEQETFRKRTPDYWHIREEMISSVEQELQTRMGGRSKKKVSGESKNHVKGRHPQKLVLIHVKGRHGYNIRLFVAYSNFDLCLLVHPFKNN